MALPSDPLFIAAAVASGLGLVVAAVAVVYALIRLSRERAASN